MKKIILLFIGILLLLVSAEPIGRFVFGLGNPLLYEISSDYGYRLKPNQDITRSGKRVMINDIGLRNGPVAEKPAAGTIRILCIGDSLTNGGEATDQYATYPYILEKTLREEYPARAFEVLNASAPGWAIANEADFVRAHGLFNSDIVLLLLNDRDIAEAPLRLNKGESNRGYPLEKPVLALQEMAEIAKTKIAAWTKKAAGGEAKKGTDEIALRERALALGLSPDAKETSVLFHERIRVFENELDGLRYIAGYAATHGAELVVVYLDTPKPERWGPGVEAEARDMYKEAVAGSGTEFVDITDDMKMAGYQRLFRDMIHPNEEGNRVIAQAVAGLLKEYIQQ